MDNKLTVEIEGKETKLDLKAKDFKTGSKGFFATGKLEVAENKRYQITCNIVLIGSKKK